MSAACRWCCTFDYFSVIDSMIYYNHHHHEQQQQQQNLNRQMVTTNLFSFSLKNMLRHKERKKEKKETACLSRPPPPSPQLKTVGLQLGWRTILENTNVLVLSSNSYSVPKQHRLFWLEILPIENVQHGRPTAGLGKESQPFYG